MAASIGWRMSGDVEAIDCAWRHKSGGVGLKIRRSRHIDQVKAVLPGWRMGTEMVLLGLDVVEGRIRLRVV